jgi:hypothetical protein
LDFKEDEINMTTVMPENESVQKAIKWISTNLEENKKDSIPHIIEKAVFKFDLSPKDTDFLLGFFRNRKAEK